MSLHNRTPTPRGNTVMGQECTSVAVGSMCGAVVFTMKNRNGRTARMPDGFHEMTIHEAIDLHIRMRQAIVAAKQFLEQQPKDKGRPRQ